MLEAAAPTLTTRQIKTLCEGKGFVKYHFALVFKREEWVITGHIIALFHPALVLQSYAAEPP
jgi:hypothetical protein